ncbi:MAG: fibronectin-binding domain-containing protein [Microcystis wesenbergii Mw_QC_S_20081001_S30D]|jgi:predicted ribosome quality control (RQC) complex YloA/Tae2 family protein|uniref:Rqc2 homolog RqcH n=1 Tax=Microcystis wesenbergii Mw_QC_S_20081001_S30D TaxID=2486245 RepID=A0A552JJC4_9CHRO|nr:fibronectin-binding domain-containing protein [Microcystis aeruginosa W11-03]NCR93318.1 fibronectin-binding domain-containing protein [Microcystis aeruginosa W11-06]TRU95866.1 MAG: fibronectin-binding domain-containing protein [Microcystis wesenbergii Mw_QC_S_20081001_S30D]TRV03211.1 MAG: fibronectin-binding domain-containing protein [Microcystis wesenbergii Mw_QC_S_20081001_S30]TRV05010.1 MAG: fibronectin-binding domain-containing protein [Microcystis wesenbergii Mw_QC_B_20070930_S4D]TRV08
MQSLDFTTLSATCAEIAAAWLPARLEQVYQIDRQTIALYLRTFDRKGWLIISWHPQGARLHIGDPPPKVPDTFTFSDQLRHQLNGFALTKLAFVAPWERVIDLQFAQRPDDPALWHLYIEIMGKYSNVILTAADNQIVTVAHQVNATQSSVRTVQTGQIYQLPPVLLATDPSLEESLSSWQARVSLIPKTIEKQLVSTYRGVSPVIARSLLQKAKINPKLNTDHLDNNDWEKLFSAWQEWLKVLENKTFQPGWTSEGYTVIGGEMLAAAKDVQELLNRYYSQQINQESFRQLQQKLNQKITSLLTKLQTKAAGFQTRLAESAYADRYKEQGDLLMANLQQIQQGMTSITLADFETGKPVIIPLDPERNPVQNAQYLYKQHQKLKRARLAVEPLLEEVVSEINYLEQVRSSLSQLENYSSREDLQALDEIQEELIQQKYLESNYQRNRTNNKESEPMRFTTPSGVELWIGRNNRQNDRLTFRSASDYDIWFHSQEIAGSHVLLRLSPGTVPEAADLQFAADYAAYYSRARHSEQVPVVYTRPKYVYKPKGAKPGMVVYKQETVIWGCPQRVEDYRKK